jgi:hypothetical protein
MFDDKCLKLEIFVDGLVGFWCLTSLSTLFQLYRGGRTIIIVRRCTRKIVEKGKIDIPSKHLHNLSLQERVAELS